MWDASRRACVLGVHESNVWCPLRDFLEECCNVVGFGCAHTRLGFLPAGNISNYRNLIQIFHRTCHYSEALPSLSLCESVRLRTA